MVSTGLRKEFRLTELPVGPGENGCVDAEIERVKKDSQDL